MTEQQIRQVAVYVRQSSGADEERSESIKIQKERLLELADSKNWEVLTVGVDADTSGRTYPDSPVARSIAQADVAFQTYFNGKGEKDKFRAGLAQVMAVLPMVQAVLVFDPTRLMRPLSNSFLENYIKGQIEANQTLVVTADGQALDYGQFATQLTSSVQNLVEDNAVKLLAKKAQQARAKKRAEGQIWTNKFYKMLGYTRTAVKGEIDILPEEAETVRHIFNLYADGLGIASIIRNLNETGRKTKEGGKWNSRTVKMMLLNVGYIGFDNDSDGTLINVPAVEPIIEEALFWKVQRIAEGKAKATGTRQRDKVHPVSGLLVCKHCSSKLLTRKDSNTGNSYYICPNALYKHTAELVDLCKTVRVNEDVAKEQYGFLRTGILQALLPFVLGQVATDYLDSLKDKDIEAEQGRIKADLEALNGRIDELSEGFALGKVGFDVLSTATKSLEVRKTQLTKALTELQKQASVQSDSMMNFPFYAWEGLTQQTIEDEAKLKTYRETVRRTIEKVICSREQVEVHLHNGQTVTLKTQKHINSYCLPVATVKADIGTFDPSTPDVAVKAVYADKGAYSNPEGATRSNLFTSEVMTIDLLTVAD